MPLLESFRQKEVSNLNHGLSSTLSPLAPPFTVKRNAVNMRPSSSQLVEPTFRDYPSPLSGSLDNCRHLHPPTSAPECWRPIEVGAGLGVPNYPTSAVGGVPNNFSFSSGAYEYNSVPVDMELPEERVVPDESYSAPLVLEVQDAAGSGFGSSTGSSMPEYFPWHSDYSIYYPGAVPSGSSQNSGYSANNSKFKLSVQQERFQSGELVKEKQLSDVGQSCEQPSLPKIKTCRSNSACPQEHQLPQPQPGFSAREGLPDINQGGYFNSSRRPSQIIAKVMDLKCLSANHQAEISKNDIRLPSVEVSGATTLSPSIPLHDYVPPPSDVLPATNGSTFMRSDAVSTNKCFIEHSSCTTDSTAVYPSGHVLQPISSGNRRLNDTVIPENVNHGCLPVDELVISKDFAGYIFSTGKGSESNSVLEAKPVHNLKGAHDSSINCNTICSQGMEDSFSSYQGALDCLSDRKPFGNLDLITTTLNLFSSAPEQSLDVSAASCPVFHEKNDQFFSAVDSPCWKGIPSFRPSEAADNISSQCWKNFESSDKPLPVQNRTVSLSEASGQLIWSNDECIGGSSTPALHMTAVSLPPQTKSSDIDEANVSASKSYSGDVYEGIARIGDGFSTSISLQEGHELKIPIRVSLTNEKSKTFSVGESIISEATVKDCSTCNKGIIQEGLSDLLSQPVGHIQSSFCAGTSISTDVYDKINGLSHNPSEHLPERTDTHLLLKAMYNLSALLLSRCYADQNALKEHDLEVLQLVTNNLDECIVKQSNHLSEPCPPLESSHFEKLGVEPGKFTCIGGSQCIPAESIDDIRLTGNKKTSECGRSIHMSGIPKNIGFDKFASFHDENGVHKAMEKLLKDKLESEGDDLPQIQVYKTLWLEAEAALCAMKYEVRLATMKAEILRGKQDRDAATFSPNARSNFYSGPKRSLNDSLDAIDGDNQNLHAAKSSPSEHNNCSLNARSNFNAGVVNSVNGICDIIDRNDQNLHEANSASEQKDLESSVIARFKILKCRIEGSNKEEKQHPTLPESITIESTEDVDDPVMVSETRTEIGNYKQPPSNASLVPAISTCNTQASRSSNGDFGAAGVVCKSQHVPKALSSNHNDVEATIAARIKILKERNVKCGISDGEPAILPESIDVEGMDCEQQPKAAVFGYCSQSKAPETSKNFNMDIGFTAQSWQPFAVAAYQDALSVNLHDQLCVRHAESPAACASTAGNRHHMPWQELETRAFRAQTGNGVVSLKCPSPSGGVSRRNEPVKASDKRTTGGATSSSQSDSAYDWEHVLKEEISC
ncbi:unnamed protein product [Victoria cruziana]